MKNIDCQNMLKKIKKSKQTKNPGEIVAGMGMEWEC